MAYFSRIESNRRFRVIETGEVVAIYDQSRSCTYYAPVGVDEKNNVCFVDEPRTYWPDEVEEIR